MTKLFAGGEETPMLDAAVAEIEAHVHAAGWDQRPVLFALVRAEQFTADDPDTAQRLGVDILTGDALTPIEQDELPDEPLDEVLAGIAWPDSVTGVAVSQEIVILPPEAEAGLSVEQITARAADHPDRREARLVVGVLRGGRSAALLRMRAIDGAEDDLLTGPDLAPNLVAALLATLD
ncbi:MAG: PPA1309 family protein [Jatrophihabitans sp.]